MKTAGSVAFFVPHVGCPRDCSFCNQRAISGQEQAPTPKQVKKTLEQALENLSEKAPFYEIAFFGGSFTAVEKELQHSLLQAVAPFCDEKSQFHFKGIRFSTRPDCISEEILQELEPYPITHIELGAQSMDNTVLTANNRGHTAEDVVIASSLVQQRGYSLTLQMMTGLYRDTQAGALTTAEKLAALQPNSVRIYPTLVLEQTHLAALYKAGKYSPQTIKQAVQTGAELLLYFKEKNIPVIRLGLQQSDGISGGVLAGPNHPALRELCTGKALALQIKQQLYKLEHTKDTKPKTMSYTIYCKPKHLSSLTGHGRFALKELEQQGYQFEIVAENSLAELTARLEQREGL